MNKIKILLRIIIILFTIILVVFFNCQQPSSKKGAGRDSSSSDEKEFNIIKTIDAADGVIDSYTSIAVSGSNVYISYYDWTNQNLKFARSADGGITWAILTVDGSGGLEVGKYNSIAVSGTNVYISYFDWTNQNLKFAKSTNGGITWKVENIKTIDSGGDVGLYTSIAASDTNVYISYFDWTNYDLKFAKSTDGGITWPTENIKQIDTITEQVGEYSSIAVSGSNVYISYYDSTNENLKFAKSNDGGDTWLTENIKEVDSSIGQVGWYTSLAISGIEGNNIYISYYDRTNGNLKFTKSINGGDTWPTDNIKIVDSSNNMIGLYTSIAVSGSNVYISYYDSLNVILKFAKSTDGGITWPIINIKNVDSAEDGIGSYTSMVTYGSNVYISYYASQYLKFAKSVNGGKTW